MNILITGGAGYIGSHTCVELLESGYDITVIDNLSNSKKEVIDRIKKITNKDFKFYEGDCCDKEILYKIFNEVEKTWDCPCHSSRFDIDGKCIKGPSNYDISYK